MRRLLMRLGGAAAVAALGVAGFVAGPAGAAGQGPTPARVTEGIFGGSLTGGTCTTYAGVMAFMAQPMRTQTLSFAFMFLEARYTTGTTCVPIGGYPTAQVLVDTVSGGITQQFELQGTVTGQTVTVTFQALGTVSTSVTHPVGTPTPTSHPPVVSAARVSACMVTLTIGTHTWSVTPPTPLTYTTGSGCLLGSGVVTTVGL